VQESSPSSGSQGETEGTASQPAPDPPPASDSTSQAADASQEQARGSTPSSAFARSPEDPSPGSATAKPSPSAAPSEPGDASAPESTTSEPDTGTEPKPTADDLTARAAEPARTPRPDAPNAAKDAQEEPDAAASPQPTPNSTDAAAPEHESDADAQTDDDTFAAPEDAEAPEDTPPDSPDDDTPDAPSSKPASPSPASSEAPAGNDAGYHDLFNPPALSDDDSASGDGAPQNTMQETPGPGFSNPGPAVATEPDTGTALLQTLTDAWAQYVERVKDERKGVGSLLGEARPARCANGTLRLTVPKKLHRDTLMGCTDLLRTHLPDAVDDAVDRIEIDVQAPEPDASSSTSDTPADPRAQMQALRAKYDGLNTLFTMFKAEPVW
jgi:DNA polymerase-3 subunit gamma/tau